MSLPQKDTPSIEVNHLNFSYGGPPILQDLSLVLKPGSRCILVGANGAGKTTLLRILAGKRLVEGDVKVLGKSAFIDAPKGVTYLGTEWASNPVVRSDLTVEYLLRSMGSSRWPERTKALLEVLDVDLTWRLHQVSDGQRRRVQLVMGLLQPWDILLLDEVTVDLDVLVRADFLDFLRRETEERGATIVYATHIFDGNQIEIRHPMADCELLLGLGRWPTHVAHVANGTVLAFHSMDDFPELAEVHAHHVRHGLVDSPLMGLCYKWLRDDRQRHLNYRQIDATTGQPHTKWDDLSEDMQGHGDKYFNYWK
ncbi:CCR4-NOT regulatory complex component [Apophysomyces ossiformis]|uniref:CCR4-NOT regulatory complex component n=1 Tax=Apophysomyces ossiformis TaxID=679940 RepID=A0A8H7BVB3_9FUNG|nr:CCR4-NOT regulatory complex component [Apophysomyces ossiformis]